MKQSILLLCILSFSFCSNHDEQLPSGKPVLNKPLQIIDPLPLDVDVNLLFVGNSLTYTNDLPGLVEQIASSKGVKVGTRMLALPNYALEDHWNDGKLQDHIKSEEFDYVIVQQGPSSQADGRIMLLTTGAQIKELCEQHNTKLAFFMVWPARVNYHTFGGVIKNYGDAAKETNSILCPVGQVWKDHFDATNDFSYYGPDQFHPSELGSSVAAQVIFETLIQR